MVLATHLVIGGVLGQAVATQPTLAFVAGFLSHFLLDAIPHWDYPLHSKQDDETDKLNISMPFNRDFVFDLAKISLDLLIGLAVLLLVFKNLDWQITLTVLAGALGGILPDFLQFAYFKLRWQVLRKLQAFHIWIHARCRLDRNHVLGPILQIALVSIVVVLAAYWF